MATTNNTKRTGTTGRARATGNGGGIQGYDAQMPLQQWQEMCQAFSQQLEPHLRRPFAILERWCTNYLTTQTKVGPLAQIPIHQKLVEQGQTLLQNFQQFIANTGGRRAATGGAQASGNARSRTQRGKTMAAGKGRGAGQARGAAGRTPAAARGGKVAQRRRNAAGGNQGSAAEGG
jgi:hypothetical protein